MIRNKLPQFLEDSGLSIAELSRSTGLTYANAHNLATGNVTRIEFATLVKLCQLFGCQPGDLLEYDPNYIPGVN